MEGDGDGEAGENEIGGVVQGVAQGLSVAEGAVDHPAQGFDGVFADDGDDQASDHERQQDIDAGQDDDIDPRGEFAARHWSLFAEPGEDA